MGKVIKFEKPKPKVEPEPIDPKYDLGLSEAELEAVRRELEELFGGGEDDKEC